MFKRAGWLRNTRILALVCVLLGAGRGILAAEEFGPLIPSKVFVEHTFDALQLNHGDSAIPAFKSKNVTCPAKHTNGCTVLVETSIEIWDVPAGAVMWEWVWASGSLITIDILESTQGGIPSQRTYQYVIPHIQAGSTVTIDVQLQNLIDTAYAGDRVETVQLFLN